MGTGIGEKIKELRKEQKLTMEMFVLDFNTRFVAELERPLNKSMVSRWESGENEPTLDNAKFLSMYYNVSLDYLIGLTDTRTPSRLLAYKRKGDNL